MIDRLLKYTKTLSKASMQQHTCWPVATDSRQYSEWLAVTQQQQRLQSCTEVTQTSGFYWQQRLLASVLLVTAPPYVDHHLPININVLYCIVNFNTSARTQRSAGPSKLGKIVPF